ncbi:hypothetical protein EE612_057352, partial [Oryza sativa]
KKKLKKVHRRTCQLHIFFLLFSSPLLFSLFSPLLQASGGRRAGETMGTRGCEQRAERTAGERGGRAAKRHWAGVPGAAESRAESSDEVSDMAASVECAVCLSVVDEGEKVRQLPACGHVFHQECINMWLSSHASCPVCHGKAAPADELADAIAVCISVKRDVVVPASSPPPSSPAGSPPAARIRACPSGSPPPPLSPSPSLPNRRRRRRCGSGGGEAAAATSPRSPWPWWGRPATVGGG